jgi:hypothetical protein
MDWHRAALPLLILSLLESGASSSPELDHFERKVRPLLVEHCYACHSAENKIKGGLRLDHRTGWETGGDSGPALTPGAWTKVKITLAGTQATVQIGDTYTETVTHPSLARPKTTLGLGFSFGTLAVKDLAVTTGKES